MHSLDEAAVDLSTNSSPLIAMNIGPEIDSESFDIEDSEDIIGLAKNLVNGRHAGILSTVDESGRPQVRWMSTLAFNKFPVFFTLTAPDSRKVD